MPALSVRCPNCDKEQPLNPVIGRHELNCARCRHFIVAITFADSTELRARLLPTALVLSPGDSPHSVEASASEGSALPDGMGTLLDRTLLESLELLGAAKGNIQIYDEHAGGLTIRTQVGFGTDFLSHFRVVKMNQDCACGKAFQARERIVCPNVFIDERFRELRRLFLPEGLVGVISTPLIGRRKVVGMLSAHFSRPHKPSGHALSLLDRTLQRVEQAVRYLA